MRRHWHERLRQAAAERDDATLAAARADIDAVFRRSERQLGDGPPPLGTFSIADVACMQRLQLFPMLEIATPAACPRVREWGQRLRARAS